MSRAISPKNRDGMVRAAPPKKVEPVAEPSRSYRLATHAAAKMNEGLTRNRTGVAGMLLR
jgi:hypothetical protein